MPIPRAIYKSKPEWYGIDDITTGMGWPSSSQSAVTMPGEAYANFGWFGLFVAVFYGVFFGLFLKFINSRGGVYTTLYASVIIPVFCFKLDGVYWNNEYVFYNIIPFRNTIFNQY